MSKASTTRAALEAVARGDAGSVARKGFGLVGKVFGKGRKKAAEEAADAAKKAWWRRPSRVIPGLLGVGFAGRALSGGDNEQPSLFDPTKINYGGLPASSTAQIDAYLKEQERIIREGFGQPLPAISGSEAYGPLSSISNQMGAATLAEMQRLAAQAAAGAQQDARSANALRSDIEQYYNTAAADMASAAARGGEYGALTPVAGAMASLPEETRQGGAALSNYLAQNQLISAQDQGFLAELAGLMGPAYANQFAMRDAAARAAADANRTARMQELELSRQQELQQALVELGLSGAQLRFNAQRENAAAPAFIDPATIDEAARRYQQIIKNTQQRRTLEAQGIFTIEDYINRMINTAAMGE